jgi:Leucine-rich repeat (LRR) protein
MEIALERIANMRNGELDLSNLGLTELPPLVFEDPSILRHLYCGHNQLTSLPQLPSTLVSLYCMGNQLTHLPPLPPMLAGLNCVDNQLTSLPQLGSEGTPSTLVHLNCKGNQLTELPQLPSTLKYLNCEDNPLQYPPDDVMEKSIAYIREWMSENPKHSTYIKSANKQ